jgi:hypothetical protein
MHFPQRSTHDVRVVEKDGLGAELYTEVNEMHQDPQDGSLPLGRPIMEGGADRPLT